MIIHSVPGNEVSKQKLPKGQVIEQFDNAAKGSQIWEAHHPNMRRMLIDRWMLAK